MYGFVSFNIIVVKFIHIDENSHSLFIFIAENLLIQSIVHENLSPLFHGLQHARPPCPSPSPKVCPSSCPLHQWCHPAILFSDTSFSFCPQSFSASGTFPKSAISIKWPKYWSFSFSLSNEYSGLVSFKIDWLDLLAVQGTLRSLLQDHSSKASILQLSAFFTVQLSIWVGKTIALTIFGPLSAE